MIVHDVIQRSEQWRALRIGMFTASCAAEMMSKVKTGEAAARRNLRTRLCLERLTGVSQENGYVNPDMERGAVLEPNAFAAYEAYTGSVVQSVGFVTHDTLRAGCSPDGWINNGEGLLELKCRRSANHLAFLRSETVPGDALLQCVHGMWITNARWVDYASYDDRFVQALQLKVVRVPRRDDEIISYALCATQFCREIDDEVAAVTALAAQ